MRIDGRIELLQVTNVSLYRNPEMPVAGSIIRTDADKSKLREYLRVGTSQIKPNPTWGSRGWPEAYATLEQPPRIKLLQLTNVQANRLASVVQHEAGQIGRLYLDNTAITDVPHPISITGDAKIDVILSGNRQES